MGGGRTHDGHGDGVKDANDAALFSLTRVLRGGKSGFYLLIASPRTQTAVIRQYAVGNVGVYDFSGEGRELLEISELMDREPGREAYVFLNFHLALWRGGEWDIDAVRRLNFSRNALAKRNRVLIFCVTPEADALLNRKAYDFYDYIKLRFRFKDEAAPALEIITARPQDLSVGVDVVVEVLDGEELLEGGGHPEGGVHLCFAAHDVQGGVGVALAHGAVAGGVEVPGVVAVARAAVGVDDVGGGNGAGHLGHDGVVAVAGSALVLAQGLADEEGYVLCLEAEVCEEVVVDLLHVFRPVGVTVVRASLM